MPDEDFHRNDARFQHPDALSNQDSRVPRQTQVGVHEPAPGSGPLPRPPRHRARTLRRFFGWLLVLILLGVVGYAIYIVSIVAKISTNPWQLGPVSADANGRTNLLVLGVGDPGHAGQELTDTMMVVSVQNNAKRVAQISLPRDMRVNIPGHGYAKINAANVYGGVPLAEQTVSNTLDIPIDYYVKTDFTGLKDIVDAVGGLDITVKTRLVDTEFPCDDNQYKSCGLVIEPGLQHMDGTQVLHYVRCRKGTCGNDFGRAERQQEVMALLKAKILNPQLLLRPAELTQIVNAISSHVQTDLGFWQMLMLGNVLRVAGDNQPVNLVLSTAPGGLLRSDPGGSSDLLPVGGDFSNISATVQNIFSTPVN